MKKANKNGLKQFVIYKSAASLTVQQVDPINSNAVNELQQLAETGLTKCLIIDTSASFIASYSALQKLVTDISYGDRITAEIIDRSQHSQSLLQIYAANIKLRKVGLTPERYQKLRSQEDLLLDNYPIPPW